MVCSCRVRCAGHAAIPRNTQYYTIVCNPLPFDPRTHCIADTFNCNYALARIFISDCLRNFMILYFQFHPERHQLHWIWYLWMEWVPAQQLNSPFPFFLCVHFIIAFLLDPSPSLLHALCSHIMRIYLHIAIVVICCFFPLSLVCKEKLRPKWMDCWINKFKI